MSLIKVMTQQAYSMLNIPYYWGGNSPVLGIDCSGFILVLLKSVGLIKSDIDMTAHDIWLWAKNRDGIGHSLNQMPEGCLVFYGSERKVTHIAYALGNGLIINAGDGHSGMKPKNFTEQGIFEWRKKAFILDARVKIKPYNYREDVFDARYPYNF